MLILIFSRSIICSSSLIVHFWILKGLLLIATKAMSLFMLMVMRIWYTFRKNNLKFIVSILLENLNYYYWRFWIPSSYCQKEIWYSYCWGHAYPRWGNLVLFENSPVSCYSERVCQQDLINLVSGFLWWAWDGWS